MSMYVPIMLRLQELFSGFRFSATTFSFSFTGSLSRFRAAFGLQFQFYHSDSRSGSTRLYMSDRVRESSAAADATCTNIIGLVRIDQH